MKIKKSFSVTYVGRMHAYLIFDYKINIHIFLSWLQIIAYGVEYPFVLLLHQTADYFNYPKVPWNQRAV